MALGADLACGPGITPIVGYFSTPIVGYLSYVFTFAFACHSNNTLAKNSRNITRQVKDLFYCPVHFVGIGNGGMYNDYLNT